MKYKNYACSGGWMTNSFKYLMVKPILLEKDYPYTTPVKCKDTSAPGVTLVKSYTIVPVKSSSALMAAVANNPTVAIALGSSSTGFKYYKSGILKASACSTYVNHAVQLVGYGNANGVNYWLIRNSWGTGWGEAGYIRIENDKKEGGVGPCGMYQKSSYPLL